MDLVYYTFTNSYYRQFVFFRFFLYNSLCGSSPAYAYYRAAKLNVAFFNWLDECGGSTAGDGVGRNKDILGHTRVDGNNYPGCRAY